LTSVEQLVNWG